MSDNAINFLTREKGLHKIVDACIEKERKLYEDTKENKKIDRDEYVTEMMSVLSKTAFIMFKNGDLSLPKKIYKSQVPCKYETQKERLLMVREIKDNQDNFRFQHRLFYDYFLLYYIAHNEMDLKLGERRKILESHAVDADSINSRRMYATFLASAKLYERITKNVKSFAASRYIKDQKPVELSEIYNVSMANIAIVDDPEWNIDRIIRLLPSIQSLRYRQFQINTCEDLGDYVDDRDLTLNKEAVLDSSGADRFGKLISLDTTAGTIKIRDLGHFDVSEEIWIGISSTSDFNELINTKNNVKIRLNLEKVLPTVFPELLPLIINENFKSERFFLCHGIDKLQINEILAKIDDGAENSEGLRNKIIFLVQLHYFETHYSEFSKEATSRIQERLDRLFLQNPEATDKLMDDLLRAHTTEHGENHPSATNLLMMYAESQYQLGICFYIGTEVEEDHGQAFAWWCLSANKGNANAQWRVGSCYYYGRGVDQNYSKAVTWWQISANQGNADARFNLGICYQYGIGVEKDDIIAFELFLKAANQDHIGALSWMGTCYYEGSGVEQDYTKAVNMFQKAANQGNGNSLYWLGICYYEGNGVEQDSVQAIAVFQKAANQDG